MSPLRLSSLSLAMLAAVSSAPASAALTAANGQFSAKLYTEALGRLPDPTGWTLAVNNYTNNACNLALLQGSAQSVLNSSEFHSTSPTAHEKVFRLYRAALHRDATAAELNAATAALGSGTSWVTIMNNVLSGSEFSGAVSRNCGTSPYGWQPRVPENRVVTSTGNVTTESDLRYRLGGAQPGTTIYLEQGATIALNSSLVIPPGVKLTTVGNPAASRAPLLGRLYRNYAEADAAGGLVRMSDNSQLSNVWIDGQQSRFAHRAGTMNVYAPASNATITNNLITDSNGWTTVQYLHDGSACLGGTMSDNIVTAYGSKHYTSPSASTVPLWTDGISIACKNVTVERNQVVDATDVGIVVYHVWPEIQTSKVRNNTVFNAGNSAYGSIAADGLGKFDTMKDVDLNTPMDFTGTEFTDNVLWSSRAVHVDVGIAVGTRPWFGSKGFIGKGARFTGNHTNSLSLTAGVAIAVSGMTEAYVQSNSMSTFGAPAPYTQCGLRSVARAPMPYAGDPLSSIQPSTLVTATDPLVISCMSHASQ